MCTEDSAEVSGVVPGGSGSSVTLKAPVISPARSTVQNLPQSTLVAPDWEGIDCFRAWNHNLMSVVRVHACGDVYAACATIGPERQMH